MSKQLTDEQRAVADEYYKENERHLAHCIHKVYKCWLSDEQFNDCMGVVYEALCEAVATFNPQKGNKLSTHVERVAKARLISNLRDSKRIKRKLNEVPDSLDQPAIQSTNDKPMTLGEVTPAKDNDDEDFNGADKYLSSLTKLQLKLIIMILLGLSRKEICRTLNLPSGTYDLLLRRMSAEDKLDLFKRR